MPLATGRCVCKCGIDPITVLQYSDEFVLPTVFLHCHLFLLPASQVGDLVSKRMVSEGFLSKTHGNLAIGPRYYLSRNTEAATNFRRDQLEA